MTLTGLAGLLKVMTKTVIEMAWDEEPFEIAGESGVSPSAS